MKKKSLMCLLLILTFSHACPQDNAFMIRQKGLINFMPMLQIWEKGEKTSISEQSTLASVFLPLGIHTGLTLIGSQVAVNGRAIESLFAISDTQVKLTHYLEKSKMIFNLNMNLPTGKSKLSVEEFDTAFLLGYQMFQFRVPSLGQGFTVSPGFSWAKPMNDHFVLGFGLSFCYKNAYHAFKSTTVQYDPGEETIFSTGFDYRINPKWVMGTDITCSFYSKDKLGQDEVLKAGNAYSFCTNFRYRNEQKTFRVLCQYRTKEKNEFAIAGGWLKQEEPVIPSHFLIRVIHSDKQLEKMILQFTFEYNHYTKSMLVDKTTVIAFGSTATWILSKKYALPVKFKLMNGDVYKNGTVYSGFEFGFGLVIQL